MTGESFPCHLIFLQYGFCMPYEFGIVVDRAVRCESGSFGDVVYGHRISTCAIFISC